MNAGRSSVAEELHDPIVDPEVKRIIAATLLAIEKAPNNWVVLKAIEDGIAAVDAHTADGDALAYAEDRISEYAINERLLNGDDVEVALSGGRLRRQERDAESKPRSTSGNVHLEKRTLIVDRASDIQPEKIGWLWPGRIARGKHTTIAGDPGTGKSQAMLSIAAAFTTGGILPCNEGRAPLGNVIVLAAEDGIADTIVPRLLAAGADLERVGILVATRNENSATQSFNLQADLDLLEKKIAEIGDVCLVCIDPISSYLGKVDSHKNAELRAVLEPIGRMAERQRVAMLSITHFNKSGAGTPTKALYRFIGSIAFTAAPRVAFVVADDPDNKDRRLLLHGKNNLAPTPQGLAYRLMQTLVGEHKDIVASYVAWESEPVSTTADEALGGGNNSDPTATDDAIEFLEAILANGPVAVSDVEKEAREAGYLKPDQPISQSKPFRSARRELRIKPSKAGMHEGWVWALPAHAEDDL
jgi:putative DNA primase/helicase